jgi:hypothetical protein
MPHTHFPKGAHVFIILRDGRKFEDVFVDRIQKHVVLRHSGKVRLAAIRSMSYRRLA